MARWIKMLLGGAVLVAVPVYAASAAQSKDAKQPATPATPAKAQAATPAAAAGAGVPATTQPVPADVRAVLDQVKAAYSELDALKVTGTLSSDVTLQGESRKIERNFSGSFQAPNRFRHEFADELVVGSTGEKTYAHSKMGNSYLLADAPAPNAPASDLPRPIPEIIQTQNPSLMLALEQDPLSHLMEAGGELRKLKDVKIGDTSYTAIGTTYPGGVEVALLFDPKTHLLRRITATMPKGAAAEPVQVSQVVLDYSNTETSPKFEPAQFAWTPPEGATDVAAERPQIEQGAAQKLVGQPAPDFKLTNLKGETVALSELKGQTVLLDFWASWCPPCVESLPHLGRLYGEKQDGVQVLAINMMEDKSQVQSFAKAQNINIPILLDQSGEVAQKYHVSSIPQTVLIGPDGQVKKVFVGLGPDMYSQLAEAIQDLKTGGGAGGAATPAAEKTSK